MNVEISSNSKFVPSTIDMVHKTLLLSASQATMDVKTFKATKQKLSDKVDFEKLQKFATDLLRNWDIRELDVKTFHEFRHMLIDKPVKESIRRSNEFCQLDILCERGRMFDNLVKKIKDKLEVAGRNNIVKYCISFINESSSENIRLAIEYDNKIHIYRHKLEELLDKMDQTWAEYEDLKSPFVFNYLGSGVLTTKLIDEFCSLAIDVSETIKTWVYEDKSYPAKLWDEIVNSNGQKHKLTETIKREKRKMYEFDVNTKKNMDMTKRLLKNKSIIETQINSIEITLKNFADQLKAIEEEINFEREELLKNETIMNNRNFNSPTLVDMYWSKIDRSREKLESYNMKKINLLEETFKAKENLKSVQMKYDNFSKSIKDDNNESQGSLTKRQSIINNINSLNEQVRIKEDELKNLKVLREMKLSSKILKQINQSD